MPGVAHMHMCAHTHQQINLKCNFKTFPGEMKGILPGSMQPSSTAVADTGTAELQFVSEGAPLKGHERAGMSEKGL